MQIRDFLEILTIVILAHSGWKTEACGNYSDGCTIFNGFPFKKTFEPACNRHDVCYSCGAKYKFSRTACDTAFLNHMTTLCTSVISSENDTCYAYANIYFAGVQLLGEEFYSSGGNNSYCDQNWVQSCLP